MNIAILIPCRNHINPIAVHSWMELTKEFPSRDYKLYMEHRAHVHVARWELLRQALDNGATHLLWLDDDCVIGPGVLSELFRLIEEGAGIALPVFTTRSFPVALRFGYATVTHDGTTDDKGCPLFRMKTSFATEIPKEDTPVHMFGFHCLLMTAEAAKRTIAAANGQSPFQFVPDADTGFERYIGEDACFAQLSHVAGVKAMLAAKRTVGHIGDYIFSGKDFNAGHG